MTFNLFSNCKKTKAVLKDDRGVVATEFALITPVLLLVLLGVIELTNALMAERKLLNSVQSAADLIGQQTDVTTTDLNEIYLAANLTMSPLSTVNYTVGVASVRFDDISGTPALDWTSNYNNGSVVDPEIKAIGRGEAGASIVMVTGTYVYRPLIRLIIPVDLILSETSYVRPRKVDYIMKL